ncbi:hypothetical protein BDM02DRAFT_3124928 [Thelephora ganbajun]|uniref:Uncharacterized protein n=1 Tax=Thelephora ganbajun TaxID=370292 RepID=A0ACB6YXI6_THEGA|nr:hypothetical protein BDM02DRAFT_3124928 [Thelephora ganbajun]
MHSLRSSSRSIPQERPSSFLRPSQKPVPFIPTLNTLFEVWFKAVRCPSQQNCR